MKKLIKNSMLLGLMFFCVCVRAEVADEGLTRSDAGRCEDRMKSQHQLALNQRFQQIIGQSFNIEAAINDMKRAGEIATAQQEDRIRSQLTMGVMFANEGLLHEVVYQVFKNRFGSDKEIKEALRGFSLISDAHQKGELLSEVIERVLQFIPEIDAQNVNQVPERAAFLGMSASQLRNFHDQWQVYDDHNAFVEIMQGGILAIMLTSPEHFINGVIARGSLFSWHTLRRLTSRKEIKIPDRPDANLHVNFRQVEIENRPFYNNEQLEAYLVGSSVAARRFFLDDRIEYLTIEQLRWAFANHQTLRLKASLVEILRTELQWRSQLKPRYEILFALEQDLREAEMTLALISNRMPYDKKQVHRDVQAIRTSESGTFVHQEAVRIVREYRNQCDSVTFVNLVSTVIEASTKLWENPRLAIMFFEEVVRSGNLIGLQVDHAQKVKELLGRVINQLPSSHRQSAQNIVAQLTIKEPKYKGFTAEQLNGVITQLQTDIAVAQADVEAAYRTNPRYP